MSSDGDDNEERAACYGSGMMRSSTLGYLEAIRVDLPK
jgi:hypothetical protein